MSSFFSAKSFFSKKPTRQNTSSHVIFAFLQMRCFFEAQNRKYKNGDINMKNMIMTPTINIVTIAFISSALSAVYPRPPPTNSAFQICNLIRQNKQKSKSMKG